MREPNWAALLSEYRKSGQSCLSFCKSHGISYYRFRSALGKTNRKRSSFIEVTPSGRGSVYTVTVANGRSITVPEGFSEYELKRLLRAVEDSSC